jgi:hypothetical protein
MMGVIGVLLHRSRQLFHAGCRLLNGAACCSVREERSVLPAEISLVPR